MRISPLIAILIVILGSCDNDDQRANQHFLNATAYFEKKDFLTALIEVDSALNFDSTNCDILILKAKIKSKTNNDQVAIKILKSVLHRSCKIDTVNYLIGLSYFNLGSFYVLQKKDVGEQHAAFENSVAYFDFAIEKNPKFLLAYVNKQNALHNLGRFDDALIAIELTIRLFKGVTSLVSKRGVEKYFLGDNVGAMNDLNASIQSKELDSIDLAVAYRFRGEIFFSEGRVNEAISDLTSAIYLNPKDLSAYSVRAKLYRSKELKEKACEDYRKAAELGYVSIYEIIEEYCGK